MDAHDRFHRPDLERTEVRRDVRTYFRDSTDDPHGREHSGNGEPAAAAENIVGYGVQLGYSVIEQQIKEGQRLAARLRGTAEQEATKSSDAIDPMLGRVLNLFKDTGAVFMEAFELLARNPAMWTSLATSGRGATAPEDNAGATYGVEISSPHRTQVRLNLTRRPQGALPVIHALHAPGDTVPPLNGVRFGFDPASATPILHVEIPPGQPVATYTGAVVDGQSNEPIGTLCVRLLA